MTLAQFLMHNEGKRCVVVLDVGVVSFTARQCLTLNNQEVEKTEDEKVLWSLLMPWELGEHHALMS